MTARATTVADQPAETGPPYGWWDETPAEAGRCDRSHWDDLYERDSERTA
ncbi:hypothetical protein [Streptomyces sp. NPDC093223]